MTWPKPAAVSPSRARPTCRNWFLPPTQGRAAIRPSSDQLLSPLYVVYLWVTIGNGLRYGPRFLAIAVAMA